MVSMRESLQEQRELVATSCRIIGMLELSNPTQGHVSYRMPGEDKCLIRARGPQEAGLLYTTADEILIVDFDGQMVDGAEGLSVPIEVFIHTAIYKARLDVNSVIHIHPSTVVLFTICDTPLLPIIGSYSPSALSILLNDRLSHYDRSILIRTPELGDELVANMGHTDLCMMRGHGITSIGHDVQEATVNAIDLYELARINFNARQLGNPRPIRDDDIEEFRKMLQLRAPQAGAARQPSGMVYSLWRFYERRLRDFERAGQG